MKSYKHLCVFKLKRTSGCEISPATFILEQRQLNSKFTHFFPNHDVYEYKPQINLNFKQPIIISKYGTQNS